MWIKKLYRMKIFHPCQTKDMVTRLKVNFCGNVLNILLCHMKREYITRLCIFISSSSHSSSQMQGPVGTQFTFLGSYFGATITSIPSRNHLLERHHFTTRQHIAWHSIPLYLCSTRQISIRRRCPLESIFNLDGAVSLPPRHYFLPRQGNYFPSFEVLILSSSR